MRNNPLPPPARIEDVGLEQFLDDTRHIHNDFGYDHFVSMIGDEYAITKKTKVDKSNIGRAFGVTRQTIANWLKIYDRENN